MAILNKVLFSDGEGLTHGDLNNLQTFSDIKLIDGVMREQAYVNAVNFALSNDNVFIAGDYYGEVHCPGDGLACFPSSTTREVSFIDGIIIVPRNNSSPAVNGVTPSWRMYWGTQAEISSRTRPAATSNPRWDILSVQLTDTDVDGDSETRNFKDATTGALTSTSSNKTKRTTATFQWTQGTEAASPTEPSIPSGYFKICAVLVTPSMTTFDPLLNQMRDYRSPLGISISQKSVADEQYLASGGSRTLTFLVGTNTISHIVTTVTGTSDTHYTIFACPFGSARQRVTAWEVMRNPSVATTHNLKMGVGFTDVVSSSGNMSNNGTMYNFMRPTGPLWCNGYAAGVAAERALSSSYSARTVQVAHVCAAPASSETCVWYWSRWVVKGF